MEIYRDIMGYEGLYRIYLFPVRIKSIKRKYEKIMKLCLNDSGYLCVDLWKDNKRRRCKVHKLVLETFVGQKPFSNAICRHLDGNKLNLEPKNLVWGSYKENNEDKIIHGTSKNVPRGTKHYNSKLTKNDIKKIIKLSEYGISNRKIAKIMKVSHMVIGNVLNKKSYVDINKEGIWIK